MLRVFYAFLKRDLITETSYAVVFVMQFVGIISTVVMFYFISALVDGSKLATGMLYAGSYFSFVLVGLAAMGYTDTAIATFSGKFRQEQLMGTLEILLSMPTSPWLILLASSLWEFLQVTVRAVIILGIGVAMTQMRVPAGNLLVLVGVVIVALPSFIGLGIIGAAFVIVFKRGNPIVFVFGSASRLLSGVFFPVAVMPSWLQDLAQLLPLTHFLHALRLSLLEDRGLADVARPLGILLIFAVVLYPLSLVTFAFATRHAKRAGALATY